MRITKRTCIAMRVLMYCAAHPDRLVTKHEIARSCQASENHLAQVIHKLAVLGFLDTQRGRSGGVRLAHKTEDICVGDIFRAIEGPMPIEECFPNLGSDEFSLGADRLKYILADAAEAFNAHLDQVTLKQLVGEETPVLSVASSETRPPASIDDSNLSQS